MPLSNIPNNVISSTELPCFWQKNGLGRSVLWKFISTGYWSNQEFQCNGDQSFTNQMSVSHTYVMLLNPIRNCSARLYKPIMKTMLDQIWFLMLSDNRVLPHTQFYQEASNISLSWCLKSQLFMLLHLLGIKAKRKTVRRAFLHKIMANNYSGDRQHLCFPCGRISFVASN